MLGLVASKAGLGLLKHHLNVTNFSSYISMKLALYQVPGLGARLGWDSFAPWLSCEDVENSLAWKPGNEATDQDHRNHQNTRPKLAHDHSPISHQNLPRPGLATVTGPIHCPRNWFILLAYPAVDLREQNAVVVIAHQQHFYCACQHLASQLCQRVQRPNTPSSQWKVRGWVTGTLLLVWASPYTYLHFDQHLGNTSSFT